MTDAETCDFTDEGWSKEDAANYKKTFEGLQMVSPKIVGRAYAHAVTKSSREISGSVLEYTEPEIQALVGSS